jgi:hypothetical protein
MPNNFQSLNAQKCLEKPLFLEMMFGLSFSNSLATLYMSEPLLDFPAALII